MDQLTGYPYPVDYDLTNCDKEPLHNIAVVQGHACLVAYDKTDFVVKQTSTNTENFLGRPSEGGFSYSLSHDLRPLRTIEGLVNILKEDYGHLLNDEGHEVLRTINDNAAKMNAFISDLLVYFRSGKSQLITNHLSLAELVQEELQILLPDAEQQNSKVEIKIHDQLPDLVADRPSLSVVLKNLLSNALKYSRKSSPSFIEIGGNQVNNNTIFYVRDNGVGFDMQHAERIFGVFPDDEFEGTGVGLAVVKRIVHRHGGTITVESERKRGNPFCSVAPLQAKAE